MGNATFFLEQSQYDWLASHLPEPVNRTGRPVIPNAELLNGILFVLKTGCRWQDIPASICEHGYTSCWRRLSYWCKRGQLKLAWQRILVLLDREGKIDLTLGNMDGTLV
jgi:transposase